MNMRNATCVGTQTSKVPTRVALLFILYTVIGTNKNSIFLLFIEFTGLVPSITQQISRSWTAYWFNHADRYFQLRILNEVKKLILFEINEINLVKANKTQR